MDPLHCILVPLAFAATCFVLPSNRLRPLLLPVGALVQLGLTLAVVSDPPPPSEWLAVDAVAKVFLLALALLFTCCAGYAPGYLRVRRERPNRRLCGGLFLQVALLSLVATTSHLGLLWVALETTTLLSAPLLYFNRTPKALEAAWKFLLLGSVGIALALLGTLFLAYSVLASGHTSSLRFDDLVQLAPNLSKPWLHAAFVTLFVGYGTKMGLAPMHSWKPDAYGEAPGLLGAMLAGGVTAGAFLAILRILSVVHAAGEGGFARPILLVMGLVSMGFAAVFLVRQHDVKRMLAYSSVEHMGILVVGAGLGGPGLFGALLHVWANALTKCVMFLSVGNLHRAYGSKHTNVVRGALVKAPASAALLLTGFLAITGSPPFAPFLSEFTIARAAFAGGHPVAAVAFLALLMAAFLGMGRTVLTVVLGRPAPGAASAREPAALTLPILLPVVLVAGLGIWLPPPLRELLELAAAQVEATR